jgi:hypothetical protein
MDLPIEIGDFPLKKIYGIFLAHLYGNIDPGR